MTASWMPCFVQGANQCILSYKPLSLESKGNRRNLGVLYVFVAHTPGFNGFLSTMPGCLQKMTSPFFGLVSHQKARESLPGMPPFVASVRTICGASFLSLSRWSGFIEPRWNRFTQRKELPSEPTRSEPKRRVPDSDSPSFVCGSQPTRRQAHSGENFQGHQSPLTKSSWAGFLQPMFLSADGPPVFQHGSNTSLSSLLVVLKTAMLSNLAKPWP